MVLTSPPSRAVNTSSFSGLLQKGRDGRQVLWDHLGVEWIVVDALSIWFSTHVIRGLIVQFKHNRVKVYHLYMFTHSSDFKPFQCKKRWKRFGTRALSCMHTRSEGRFRQRTNTKLFRISLCLNKHIHIKLWQNTHLDNNSGKRSQLCLKWMKTAEKEVGWVSLRSIRASGLKVTASYKYLLLSLMLIKPQNTALTMINLYFIYKSEHYAVLFYP